MTWTQAVACMDAGLNVYAEHCGTLGKDGPKFYTVTWHGDESGGEHWDDPYSPSQKDFESDWILDCKRECVHMQWFTFSHFFKQWAEQSKKWESGARFSKLEYIAECIDGEYALIADDLRNLATAMRELVGIPHVVFVTCPVCHGDGSDRYDIRYDCMECRGTGLVRQQPKATQTPQEHGTSTKGAPAESSAQATQHVSPDRATKTPGGEQRC